MQRGTLRKATDTATFNGVSVVAHFNTTCSTNSDSRSDNPGCLLLLGSVTNALAAVSNPQPATLENGIRVNVQYIVAVADNSKAAAIRKAIQEQKQPNIQFESYRMPDRLRPEETVSLREMTAKPIQALRQALNTTLGLDTLEKLQVQSPQNILQNTTTTTIPLYPAILIHCNEGHNRAPTLTLAFLIHIGLSLREAYKLVLAARPGIDPLPPYRKALREQEVFQIGRQTVQPTELFQFHLSELLQIADQELQQTEKCNNHEHPSNPISSPRHSNQDYKYNQQRVQRAVELKHKAIDQLLSTNDTVL